MTRFLVTNVNFEGRVLGGLAAAANEVSTPRLRLQLATSSHAFPLQPAKSQRHKCGRRSRSHRGP